MLVSTAEFTIDAKQHGAQIEMKLVLMGGQELAQRMIDHGIGVEGAASCRVYHADADCFAGE